MKLPKVIVILGGGLAKNGSLPTHVIERIKNAHLIYNEGDQLLASSRYSLNVPQKISSRGYVINEAKKILDHGLFEEIPHNLKFLELFSTDTIGSALFTSFMIQQIKFLHRNVVVVTNSWHMERVRRIFSWAIKINNKLENVKISYNEAASASVSMTRNNHEQRQLSLFENKWEGIDNFSDAFTKIFTEHDNYNYLNKSKTEFMDQQMFY